MYYLLTICIVLLIILILYNNININICSDDNINIDNYKIITKKSINQDDKYNIKQYDIINDNIIIHNKYKNELINLKKYKNTIDNKENEHKLQKLEKRNQEIKINSDKLKIHEFKQKIKLLNFNIQSLKLSLKEELRNFLNDYKQNNITPDEIKMIIYNLKKELDDIEKLSDTEIDDIIDTDDIDEYHRLLNIKKSLIEKKINIFTKFLK